MPTVEIDEVELRNMAGLKNVASKIMANPKARKLLEQAHKIVNPNAETPALDQEAAAHEPLNSALEEVRTIAKEIKEDREKRSTDEKLAALNNNIEKGLAKLRDDGWTDEGIKGVRKIMDEKGIVDPEIAAAYHEKLHPPQMPATPSGGSGAWNFMEQVGEGEADLKRLIETKGENNALLDKMARDALNDVRGASRR